MAVLFDQSQIDDLVARPSESLNTEVKRWINPDDAEGSAKIARAALGLRNRNGGFLIIGFDDKTMRPDVAHTPEDPRATFHGDKIQSIVSRYAYDLFEVTVAFGKRGDIEHPVIVVPAGVRLPNAAKADLASAGGKHLVRVGEVYFRTLGSNGMVSTAPARPADWREIMDICFENREADFGRFIRRLVGDGDMVGLLSKLSGHVNPPPDPTLQDRAKALSDYGERRYFEALKRRGLSPEAAEFDRGAWSVALVVDPDRPNAVADKSFLNSVAAANPNYTGWPVWLDSETFSEASSRPVNAEKGWESLIISLGTWSPHVDFMRKDPKGNFYLRRVLQDDLTNKVPPGKALDGIVMLLRVAETIAASLRIIKGLGWPDDKTKLGFYFRWDKLSGRQLSNWANPLVGVLPNQLAVDDSADAYIEIPLDTPTTSIAPYVEQVLNELFGHFSGFQISAQVTEAWVQRLVERRL